MRQKTNAVRSSGSIADYDKIRISKISDKEYLDILKDIFDSFKIPTSYYSIGGYSEEAFCIEYSKDDKWIVYSGEKGNKYNEKHHKSLVGACHDLIYRISVDANMFYDMQIMFDNTVDNMYSDPTVKRIALLTSRISELSEIVETNPNKLKIRSLNEAINFREKLLATLKEEDIYKYNIIIKKLDSEE